MCREKVILGMPELTIEPLPDVMKPLLEMTQKLLSPTSSMIVAGNLSGQPDNVST